MRPKDSLNCVKGYLDPNFSFAKFPSSWMSQAIDLGQTCPDTLIQ